MNFADKLYQTIQKTSPLVLGIDPDLSLMPDLFLPKTPEKITQSLVNFSTCVLDICQPWVCAVKFQSAYFEQYGTLGMTALSQAMTYAKAKKISVILDAKRGDIGTSSEAYATAFLRGSTKLHNGVTLPSDLEADALTVSPYMGEDSLEPFVKAAIDHKKGLFILVKTSNPGSKTLQDQHCSEKKLFEKTAELVHHFAVQCPLGESGYSAIGAVVGATQGEVLKQLRSLMPTTLFLMPGVGAQGSSIATLKRHYDPDLKGVLIPISRGITQTHASLSLQDFKEKVKENIQGFYKQIELV